MVKLDEIAGDVKVLIAQMEDVLDRLRPLSEAVTCHNEKLHQLENVIIPPIKEEVEKSKKFRWVSAGISSVIGFLSGTAAGH